MSSVRVRFAPSPTGTLHVGGARTALFNWLYARNQGGTFVLRIEDTDRERSTEDSHQQILRSLRWLGLDWDEGPEVGGEYGPYVQSQRRELYREYTQRLLDEGLGYRCVCTPEELANRREVARREGRSVGYDGRCRRLDPEDLARREAEGCPVVIRVRMPDSGSIRWTDIVHGPMEFQNAVLDDWVAIKSDGLPTYNFAVVVDDGLMRISHVLRGDDHVSNTPRQIHLFQAFGFRVPKFGHMPMVLGPDKQRLSKRHGAASVEEFRDQGFLASALVNYLALLGWSPGDDREVFSVEQLVKAFSLKRLNNTAAVFDPEKCRHINAEHMKRLGVEEKAQLIWPRLVEAGLVADDDAAARRRLTAVVRVLGNRLRHVGDAPAVLVAYFTEEYPVEADGARLLDEPAPQRLRALADAYEALAEFSASSAEAALRSLAEEMGVEAGDLIHPARFALIGTTSGPGLFEVMEVLGQETVIRRLRRPRLA